MSATKQHTSAFYLACAIAAISLVLLLPMQRSHHPSPMLYAIGITPIGAGYLVGVYFWAVTKWSFPAFIVGGIVAVLGWYFPIALLIVNAPPMIFKRRLLYIVFTGIFWGAPIVFISVQLLTA